jgi:hypothetical protein
VRDVTQNADGDLHEVDREVDEADRKSHGSPAASSCEPTGIIAPAGERTYRAGSYAEVRIRAALIANTCARTRARSAWVPSERSAHRCFATAPAFGVARSRSWCGPPVVTAHIDVKPAPQMAAEFALTLPLAPARSAGDELAPNLKQH